MQFLMFLFSYFYIAIILGVDRLILSNIVRISDMYRNLRYSFAVPHRYLLTGVFALVRPFGYTNLQNNVLIQILLYGDQNLPNELNKNILLLTLQFIHKSGRFD